MCFCLSGCMINWWTHRSPLAFSFNAVYPVFSRRDVGCFVDFVFSSTQRLNRVLTFFPFALLDLLFSPVWIFSSFFPWLPAFLCAYQPSFSPAFIFLFLPSSTVHWLLVRGFWAMLSSPTVILQPYGLPVYPQTTTCYPSIVQVNSLWFVVWTQNLSSSLTSHVNICPHKPALSNVQSVGSWKLLNIRWLRI